MRYTAEEAARLERFSARNRLIWKGSQSGRDGSDSPGKSAPTERAATRERPDTASKRRKGNARYSLQVLHFRKRRVDPDGLVIKHQLDGIVDGGVIPDDSSRYISSVQHVQHLVSDSADERMVFIFTRSQ